MLRASIGTCCYVVPAEQAHQVPSCTFSLPKSQQLRGTQLYVKSISGRHVQPVRGRRTAVTKAESKTSTAAPWKKADARLVLADGSVWRGRAFGATDTEIGEVVFNTSITGYEEIMTDPSYRGQFVVFTHPHIGNVGINMGKWLAMSPCCMTTHAFLMPILTIRSYNTQDLAVLVNKMCDFMQRMLSPSKCTSMGLSSGTYPA